MPICTRYWKKKSDSPPMSRKFGQHRGTHEWIAAMLFEASLIDEEDPCHHQATKDEPDDGRGAQPVRSTSLWNDHAPLRRSQDTEDHGSKANDRQDRTDEIETAGGADWLISHLAERQEYDEDNHYFTHEDVAPGREGRHRPADQWTSGDGNGTGRGDHAIGRRSSLFGEVDRHQGHDGGQNQSGSQAFEHRPTEEQNPEVRSRSGYTRADSVYN